ncbi:carboxylesterase/lipase family protein [Agromyces soli]
MTDASRPAPPESVEGGEPDPTLVRVSSGALRGVEGPDGIVRFLGVPYAAAPFGRRRFAAPEAPDPWDGERDAGMPGPSSPQAPYGGGLEQVLPSIALPGEEILHVNVWTPADRGAAGAPVLVWVHGGALTRGSNALDSYDGTPFARDGLVFVSVNYRLGAEGFSVLEGAPLNLGLLDVMAALRWVRREIEAFGGDPALVTVAGQSAGATLVAAALAHRDGGPALADRVVLQSGPFAARPPAKAARVTRLMAKDLGIAPSRDAFSAVPPDELLATQLRVTAGSTPVNGGPGFVLAVGEGLPELEAAHRGGASDEVPMLIGSTTEEHRLWTIPTGLEGNVGAMQLSILRLALGIRGRTVRQYRRNRPGASPGAIFGALATDLLLRTPINRVVDARASRNASSWVYEFAWRSPRLELGAAHVMELPAVFDRLDSPDGVALTGGAAPASLAEEMHGAWVAFAAQGEPGWERWDSRRPVRVFDVETRTVFAPREDERASWSRA